MEDSVQKPSVGQAQTQQQTQQRAQPAQQNLSELFDSLGLHTASGNSASGTTADVVKVFETIRKRIENLKGVLVPQILPIEHPELAIPAITLSYKVNKTVFYVVLLLEGLGKQITNVIDNRMGRPTEIRRSTIEYWDSKMTIHTEEFINRFYNYDLENIVAVAPIIIPKTIDLTSADQLDDLFDHAVAGLTTYINVAHNKPSSNINAGILNNNQLALAAKIDITPSATYASTIGTPLAADFNAVLYARPANQQRNQLEVSAHGVNNEIAITGLTGYIDFVRQVSQGQMVGGTFTCTGYAPVFVIDQISALGKSGKSNDSLLNQLLGLSLIMPLASNQGNWASIFEPSISDSTNKPSIGVLGLEHQPFPNQPHVPTRVDIAGAMEQFKADKPTVRQFTERFISTNPIVALDIIHGGPLEWAQRVLAGAVQGSGDEKIIIDELDKFSGNLFSAIWKPLNQPILIDNRPEYNQVNLYTGYYPAPDGSKHDIREVNYLAVLDATNGDMNQFDPFASGFVPGTNSPEQMDQKYRELTKLVPSVTITGMSTRIFLNNEFINAIDKMLAACKLQVTIEGMQDMSGYGSISRAFNAQHIAPIAGSQSMGWYKSNVGANFGNNRYVANNSYLGTHYQR